MKKTVKLTVALLGFAMVFGTSCKKYEEGPGMSLRTKKARLVNTWTIDKTVDSDGDTYVYDQDERDAISIEFKKDGTYENSFTYTFGGSTTTTTETGTWEFIDGKKKIRTTDSDGDKYEEEIILLKNKEMGTKDDDGDKTYYTQK